VASGWDPASYKYKRLDGSLGRCEGCEHGDALPNDSFFYWGYENFHYYKNAKGEILPLIPSLVGHTGGIYVTAETLLKG